MVRVKRRKRVIIFNRRPLSVGESNGVISLYEHCKQESGETNPEKIKQYMNRYYGHG